METFWFYEKHNSARNVHMAIVYMAIDEILRYSPFAGLNPNPRPQ